MLSSGDLVIIKPGAEKVIDSKDCYSPSIKYRILESYKLNVGKIGQLKGPSTLIRGVDAYHVKVEDSPSILKSVIVPIDYLEVLFTV